MNAKLLCVCRFSALDDIPRSYHGVRYQEAVLKLLAQRGRFSTFEVDTKLGRALQALKQAGHIEFIHDEDQYEFPWTGVRVLDAKKETR